MFEKYSILFIQENCIQCHGCEVACKNWRNVELGVNWRKVDTIWQGKYPDSKNVPIMMACRQCADPACAAACPVGAIEKNDAAGVVLVNRGKCIGCKVCFEACPYDVPQFGVDGTMQKCDWCFHETNGNPIKPPCVTTCPTQALILLSEKGE
ncbi:MAG: putative anaerobic dimethyl sulfoxide reductase, chain reductase, iron-sulfur subunit [Firmicutes bacterium]|nr:putative anaerobic dimethyl sulfoxide reductase, chain reductase, iron-sulfur subunit [Bacillota bacterium]